MLCTCSHVVDTGSVTVFSGFVWSLLVRTVFSKDQMCMSPMPVTVNIVIKTLFSPVENFGYTSLRARQ